MQLKEKHISSFQEAWEKTFKIPISKERALEEAIPLLEFVSIACTLKINKSIEVKGSQMQLNY